MGQYSLQTTGTGTKTLIYSDGTRTVRLHSIYNPVQEAERSVNNFTAGRASVILVSGLGLGYHISALQQRFPDKNIIIIEYDSKVITIAQKEHPEYIKGLHIINSRKDLSAYFESIDLTKFTGIVSFIHRPSYQIDKEFYDTITNDIRQYITSKISDLLTRFEFEIQWIENILRNIHKLTNSGVIKSLFGRFQGIPGIIVSAGPSLKNNVEQLQELQHKALIICVDTALKVLLHYGITPHIVMTLDSQKHSIKHFLGLPVSDFILLADLVSFPAITQHHKGPVIFSTTSKYYTDFNGNNVRETTPIMDWIEKFIMPIGDIQSGGSVATSAFDLLLNLGCSHIVLMGQDLAYTGREIHSTGTHHNGHWLTLCNRLLNLETINQNVIRKRKIKYVPAFGGKSMVISDFVFDLYRSWFEDSATKVSTPIINVTSGGARIKHTRELSIKQLTQDISGSVQNPKMILQQILQKPSGFDDSRLSDAFIHTKHLLSEIIEHVQSNNGSNNKEEILSHILHVITVNDLQQLFNPFLRKSEMYITRHNINQEKEAAILLSDILHASRKLLPLITDCIQKMSK